MFNKTITLNLTSYEVTGTALLKLWGGDYGTYSITPIKLEPTKTIDEVMNNMTLKDINDGGFGCEEIIGGLLHFYEVYQGYKKYVGDLLVGEVVDPSLNNLLTMYAE